MINNINIFYCLIKPINWNRAYFKFKSEYEGWQRNSNFWGNTLDIAVPPTLFDSQVVAVNFSDDRDEIWTEDLVDNHFNHYPFWGMRENKLTDMSGLGWCELFNKNWISSSQCYSLPIWLGWGQHRTDRIAKSLLKQLEGRKCNPISRAVRANKSPQCKTQSDLLLSLHILQFYIFCTPLYTVCFEINWEKIRT